MAFLFVLALKMFGAFELDPVGFIHSLRPWDLVGLRFRVQGVVGARLARVWHSAIAGLACWSKGGRGLGVLDGFGGALLIRIRFWVVYHSITRN